MNPTLFATYLGDIARPTATLLRLAPADRLSWVPGTQHFMTLGQLLHHLAECPRACTMAVQDAFPRAEEFQRFIAEDLKNTATPEKALRAFEKNLHEAKGAVEGTREADWGTRTIRVPWGKPAPLGRVLLDVAGHWLNHKMQLFFYLKLLGYPVNTVTLYAGEVPAARA